MNAGSSQPEAQSTGPVTSQSSSEVGTPPAIGATVTLIAPVPYLKTADPMPMLRPPDLIDPGEVGVVVECRSMGMLAVRFRRGTFLLDGQVLSVASPPPPDPG